MNYFKQIGNFSFTDKSLAQEYKKVIDFLELNRFKKLRESASDEHDSYVSHSHPVSFDVNANEIVFINESGNFLHIPLNYYHLLGACIDLSIIGLGFKRPVMEFV